MPNKDKNIPKRRFKAFENADAWELRKLRNIFHNIENAFVGIVTPHYVSDGRFYLESNNIKDGQVNYETKVFISEEFYQRQKNKWLRAGDIVMVQSGHVGHSAVIPEELDCSAAHALIMFRKQKVKISSNFLNYQFQTKQSKKKLDLITTGNTIKHILSSEMKEFNAYFPSLPEQSAIGTFFSTLDRQITLHQRKLDKLKNVKQAYLSEMFPAEGERVPKRRFPGFTDAWELRKLKLLFIFKYGDGNNNPSNGGPYPVFGAGGVQGGYTEYNSENSIIIGHMGDAGCVSWGEGKHFVTYNGTITRPKEEVFTAKFGYYLLSKMNLRQYRGGSGLPFLTYDMLNDMDTIVPTNKSECDKISEFFSTLDQQITLHQRKLEKLKNLKKALLNELFV
ncbi:restriction endonuclease subunit S [Streptococcus suis]|uniref:restriction endonuclease subunit S n=1 Tax=Streptococcus suis TaxID=1307 RepID=UPI00300FF7BD